MSLEFNQKTQEGAISIEGTEFRIKGAESKELTVKTENSKPVKLIVGKWSGWICCFFQGRKGFIRFILLNSDSSDEITVLSSHVNPVTGYTQPPELAQELSDKLGSFYERELGAGEPTNLVEELGKVSENPSFEPKNWITMEQWLKICDYQGTWMANTCNYLMEKYEKIKDIF